MGGLRSLPPVQEGADGSGEELGEECQTSGQGERTPVRKRCI